MSMIFTRSFVGIYFFGFRVGELLVLSSLLICVVSILSFRLKFFEKYKILFNKYFVLIFISFFLVVVLTNTNLLNTYTYKSSSYVWTIGFLFFGVFLHQFLDNLDKKILILPIFLPLIIYIFNTGNYPNFLIDFFKENSDKFQYTKASDIFLSVVIIYFYLEKLKFNSTTKVTYLFFYTSLILPVMIILSRGSYVGILIFAALGLYFERKYLFQNRLRILIYSICAILLFILSTFRASGVEIGARSVNTEVITEQVKANNQIKDTRKAFLTFYIEDGRLFSKDETTNWRLDIWQDVFSDMKNENILFLGYGYKSIIPQMLDPAAPGRLGRDGLNEHVHNYFVTILSRGGLIQLLLFILFHLSLIRIWFEKNNNYKLFIYYIPVIFVSILDISMDGVQFPLLFYSGLGYFLSDMNSKSILD